MTFPFHLDGLSNKSSFQVSFTLEIQKGTLPTKQPHPTSVFTELHAGPVKELVGSAPCRASIPKGFVGTGPGDKQPLARKPPERYPTLPTPPLPPAVPSSPRPARGSEVRTPEQAYRRIATVPRGVVQRELATCSAGPLPARRFPAEPGARS